MTELADAPDISVIMAIRNSERFLAQALDSIVQQSFRNYEIIVVDGGSIDQGPAIARSYPRTRCIAQNGTGFAHAWNVGYAASRAPFIAFLDSDDLWTADKLAAQLDAYARNPAVEFVYGRVKFFLEACCPIPKGFRAEICEGSHLVPMQGSTMIRRSVMDRLGPFEERWKIANDIGWLAKLRDSSVAGIVDQIVLRKRLHAANLSHQTSSEIFRSEIFALLKERIDARRLAQGPEAVRPADTL